jgi:hypothetical protein
VQICFRSLETFSSPFRGGQLRRINPPLVGGYINIVKDGDCDGVGCGGSLRVERRALVDVDAVVIVGGDRRTVPSVR